MSPPDLRRFVDDVNRDPAGSFVYRLQMTPSHADRCKHKSAIVMPMIVHRSNDSCDA